MNFLKRRIVKAHERKILSFKPKYFELTYEINSRLNPMFGKPDPNLSEDHIKTLTSLKRTGDRLAQRFADAEAHCTAVEMGAADMYGITVADISNHLGLIEIDMEDFEKWILKFIPPIDADLQTNR